MVYVSITCHEILLNIKQLAILVITIFLVNSWRNFQPTVEAIGNTITKNNTTALLSYAKDTEKSWCRLWISLMGVTFPNLCMDFVGYVEKHVPLFYGKLKYEINYNLVCSLFSKNLVHIGKKVSSNIIISDEYKIIHHE